MSEMAGTAPTAPTPPPIDVVDERLAGVGLLTRPARRPGLGALPPALARGLVFAATVGFLNGLMVVTTKLPSFIVTLATFFILQGLNLGVTKQITGEVRVGGISDATGFATAQDIFGGTFWAPHDFRVSVLWWIGVTAVAAWVLARTRAGNWITGVGGDRIAARAVGVPVERVKIALFM